MLCDASNSAPARRSENGLGYNQNEYEGRLQSIFPILNAVVTKKIEISPQIFESNSRAGQEERFQDFGSDALTEREREVVQLVLINHNSNSISLELVASLTTIKTHRRNIYWKASDIFSGRAIQLVHVSSLVVDFTIRTQAPELPNRST